MRREHDAQLAGGNLLAHAVARHLHDEALDRIGDRRARQVQILGRLREAAAVDDARENLHLLEAVQGRSL